MWVQSIENNSLLCIYKKQKKIRKEKDPIYNSNNKDKTSRNTFFELQDKNENLEYFIGT